MINSQILLGKVLTKKCMELLCGESLAMCLLFYVLQNAKKIIMRKPELECYFRALESEFVDVSFLDRMPESIR